MRKLLLACSLLVLPLAAPAQEPSLRGDFSGNWFDPDQSGHGVQIEVINPREAVVAWYVFDPDGNAMWLFGVGRIEGNAIHVTLERFQGGRFPPAFDPGAVTTETWGEATLTFEDCDSGEMSWEPAIEGFEPGSMPLSRLTGIHGLRCGQSEAFENTVELSLDAGPGRWTALFADYSEGMNINAEAQWTTLPAPLSAREGWKLAGSNASDDLAMFLTAPVGELMPDTDYSVELEMEFATNAPQDCFGIGGAPGESVFVKLGASGIEPMVIENDGFFELNIDKGIQSNDGQDAVVAGDMANFQQNCPEDTEWQLKTVSTEGMEFTTRTDADGTLWVYGGTDSGFEGRTTIYVTKFTARLTPTDP